MRYHIYKGTRSYSGRGYQGASSEGVLCEFDSLEECCEMLKILNSNNPGVGWIIFDTNKISDI
jgi:hypothetical protein